MKPGSLPVVGSGTPLLAWKFVVLANVRALRLVRLVTLNFSFGLRSHEANAARVTSLLYLTPIVAVFSMIVDLVCAYDAYRLRSW